MADLVFSAVLPLAAWVEEQFGVIEQADLPEQSAAVPWDEQAAFVSAV